MQSLEQKITMSRTLERLYQLSQTLPTNVHNPDDLKEAFSTCGMDMINALDENRIHFDSDNDKAMLYGLLTVIVDYVMDGKLKTSFKQATVN